MLHTLTLNPTLDLTYLVPEFKVDDTNRAGRVYRDPGGSGINVSRVAVRLGHPTVALGFMGGHTGLEVAELLEAEHVRTWMVPIPGPTRTNPIIQNAAGEQLRVSAPGPAVLHVHVEALFRSIFTLRAPDWLVVSGSWPEGVRDDFFLRIIKRAREEGIPVAVDADDATLRGAVEVGADLIKPNRYEMERLVRRALPTTQALAEACRTLLRRDDGLPRSGTVPGVGVGAVALSLGPLGALLVRPDGAWLATPPVVSVQSAVGSGDSLLAGLCVGLTDGLSPPEALAYGVACGTSTAMTPGTGLCGLEHVTALRGQIKVEALSALV